jgi:hypothetical protein
MTIASDLVAVSAAFLAKTEKVNAPAVVGDPVIDPVDAFRLNPVGSVPLLIDHAIGVDPVAASLWL